jgi:hypothetical protein
MTALRTTGSPYICILAALQELTRNNSPEQRKGRGLVYSLQDTIVKYVDTSSFVVTPSDLPKDFGVGRFSLSSQYYAAAKGPD